MRYPISRRMMPIIVRIGRCDGRGGAMFSDATRNAICALAAVDEGVTPAEREMLSGLLSGRRGRSVGIVKYAEAARRLGLSVPSVKRLVANGRLRSVSTGGPRACGVTEDSLMRFAT